MALKTFFLTLGILACASGQSFAGSGAMFQPFNPNVVIVAPPEPDVADPGIKVDRPVCVGKIKCHPVCDYEKTGYDKTVLVCEIFTTDCRAVTEIRQLSGWHPCNAAPPSSKGSLGRGGGAGSP